MGGTDPGGTTPSGGSTTAGVPPDMTVGVGDRRSVGDGTGPGSEAPVAVRRGPRHAPPRRHAHGRPTARTADDRVTPAVPDAHRPVDVGLGRRDALVGRRVVIVARAGRRVALVRVSARDEERVGETLGVAGVGVVLALEDVAPATEGPGQLGRPGRRPDVVRVVGLPPVRRSVLGGRQGETGRVGVAPPLRVAEEAHGLGVVVAGQEVGGVGGPATVETVGAVGLPHTRPAVGEVDTHAGEAEGPDRPPEVVAVVLDAGGRHTQRRPQTADGRRPRGRDGVGVAVVA